MRIFAYGVYGEVLDAQGDKSLVLFDGDRNAIWVPTSILWIVPVGYVEGSENNEVYS